MSAARASAPRSTISAACDRCRDEVTELALTVAALRRAGARATAPLPVPRRCPPGRRAAGAAPPVGVARRSWAASITSAGIAALLVVPPPASGVARATGRRGARPARRVTAHWRSAEQHIAAQPDTASVGGASG